MDIRRHNILDSNFFKDYEQTNPYLVLGLILISFGLYIINWIYLKNKEFALIDEEAPEPNRGAIILMVLPLFWFFTMMALKHLIFSLENIILGIIEIIGWFFIMFLIHKYILDFCLTFGRITRTFGPLWFFLFFLGAVGIVGIVLQFYYMALLVFFLIIVVPAMQNELNSYFIRNYLKKEKKVYYH